MILFILFITKWRQYHIGIYKTTKDVRASRLDLSDYVVHTLNTTDKETKVQRDGNNLPKD